MSRPTTFCGFLLASMTWGGSYSGMGMQAMTVLQLAPLTGPNIAVTGTHGTWTVTNQQFVSPNTLDIDKTANDMGPFDVEIQVDGNLTSIVIDDPVLNNSGQEWPGYRFQLGYWVNDEFVASTAGDGLAFDSLATNHTSDVFSNVTLLGEDELYFSGGLVGLNGSVSFVLDIDLPGGSSFDFALRQWAVPEPGSATLFGLAVLLLLGLRRQGVRTRDA